MSAGARAPGAHAAGAAPVVLAIVVALAPEREAPRDVPTKGRRAHPDAPPMGSIR